MRSELVSPLDCSSSCDINSNSFSLKAVYCLSWTAFGMLCFLFIRNVVVIEPDILYFDCNHIACCLFSILEIENFHYIYFVQTILFLFKIHSDCSHLNLLFLPFLPSQFPTQFSFYKFFSNIHLLMSSGLLSLPRAVPIAIHMEMCTKYISTAYVLFDIPLDKGWPQYTSAPSVMIVDLSNVV